MFKANETVESVVESIKTVITVHDGYPFGLQDIIVETIRNGQIWETQAYDVWYSYPFAPINRKTVSKREEADSSNSRDDAKEQHQSIVDHIVSNKLVPDGTPPIK